MRLTRHTDNALRCLIYLALHPDLPVSVADMSRRMGMSRDHVFKVIARLSDRGYVVTHRGRGGGVWLARDAEDIRIGDVVRDTEESLALVECFEPETNQCPIAPACALAPLLDRALNAFLSVLDEVSLAAIAHNPVQIKGLLRE